jgi:hypothetical protein
MSAGIMAIEDFDGAAAGTIVWFRLSGEVQYAELSRAWLDAGLDADKLPNPVAPTAALRRAMAAVAGGRRLNRSLAGGGRALVLERAVGRDNLEYEVTLRASLDPVKRVVFDPPHHPLRHDVEQAYRHSLDVLDGCDVGPWLVDLLEGLGAVRLRDTGGVYFLPATARPVWERMREALHAASQHKVLGVPAMKTAEAVDGILDALRTDVEAQVEGMLDELTDNCDKPLGERALQTRMARCQETGRKVKVYEQLLGRKLDDLRKKLDTLHAAVQAAALAASATPEEQVA